MEAEGFRGGYYLNPRLPLDHNDFYFSDAGHDITVLAWADFYNAGELTAYAGEEHYTTTPGLIAGLFLKEGPDFVRRVNGDFVIFILRPQHKEAYLFRDQVGILPVAYTVGREGFFFSSDIISLAKTFQETEPVDTEYLLPFFKYTDYRKTPSGRVKKLLPGHYVHFSEEKVKTVKYWFPERIKTDRKLRFEDAVRDLGLLVHDATRIRCDDRFNASAHVSGGLDSGIVALLARKEYAAQDRFYGFSWSPEEYRKDKVAYDERYLVRKCCEAGSMTPVFNDMTSADLYGYSGRYYENQGYFFEDRVTDQAAERGVNLIFSGWGGDEFISTGDRGIEIDLLKGFHLKTFLRRNPLRPLRRFVRWQLFYVIYPLLGIRTGSIRRSFSNDARYLRREFKKSNRRTLNNYFLHHSRRGLHLRMLRFYHLQERCESWAVNGYSKGIRYRYPLLDRRIIEYMLKVPSMALCHNTDFRPLLREIGKGIMPEEVRCQKLKSDPFCWGHMHEMTAELTDTIIEEVDRWRKNDAMAFVDFSVLDDDIRRYRHSPETVDLKVLSKGLFYLRSVYGFMMKYRNSSVIP